MKVLQQLILTMCMILLNSCGFYSFTGASISPDIQSVSVELFQNNAQNINPKLSQVFTEKLKDYFVVQTNLSIQEDKGDLSFSGEITHYEITPIAIQANETARRNRLTIKVKVNFENKFNQKSNFSKTFSRYKDFSSEENIISIEEDLIQIICDELAEDIFNKSVVNW